MGNGQRIIDGLNEAIAHARGDESHLPVERQSLSFRLRKRAEIRRNNKERKSVQEGRPDRAADLMDEAAARLDTLIAALRTIGHDTYDKPTRDLVLAALAEPRARSTPAAAKVGDGGER